MTYEEKAVVIDELTEKFKSNVAYYIADAGGMSVAEINSFRRLCFDKGLEYKVFKNTLIKKALSNIGIENEEFNKKVLKGYSGVLFSEENPKAPAKLLRQFKKSDTKNRPAFKGAMVFSEPYIGEDQLEALENLKTKQELIGEIVGLLQSPAKRVIAGLQSGGHKLSGIIKTLSEKE